MHIVIWEHYEGRSGRLAEVEPETHTSIMLRRLKKWNFRAEDIPFLKVFDYCLDEILYDSMSLQDSETKFPVPSSRAVNPNDYEPSILNIFMHRACHTLSWILHFV